MKYPIFPSTVSFLFVVFFFSFGGQVRARAKTDFFLFYAGIGITNGGDHDDCYYVQPPTFHSTLVKCWTFATLIKDI
jgi:hypothetical protein